ncbi:MAG: sigma-70 family RNA polymerase sigma factor [Acidobacteriota bacterium]
MSREGESAPPEGGADRWQLTQRRLSSLLQQLASDPGSAGELYRQLHHRLCRFFQWEGLGERAEELADRTLDRVASKVRDGLQIEADDPYRYISRVARFIVYEAHRDSRRQRAAKVPAEAAETWSPTEAEEEDPRLDTLETCLQRLTKEDQQLIRSYYGDEGSKRSKARQELAENLGISRNGLRIRAHRIRKRLEGCIQGLTEKSAELEP